MEEYQIHITLYRKEEKSFKWDFKSTRYVIADLNDFEMITKFINQVLENNKILEEIFSKAEKQ